MKACPSLIDCAKAADAAVGTMRGRQAYLFAYVDRSLARLGRLAITGDEETDDHGWSATRTLARQEDLSLYDAAYLELALRRRMPLASCDKALLAAAARRKVQVFAA